MSFSSLIGQSVCKVQRQASTRDAAGGFANTWTDLYSGVRCRIEDASAATVEKFARLQMEVTHEIITQQAGVTNGMRIIANGRTFVVQSTTTNPATGRIPFHVAVYAEEVKSRA